MKKRKAPRPAWIIRDEDGGDVGYCEKPPPGDALSEGDVVTKMVPATAVSRAVARERARCFRILCNYPRDGGGDIGDEIRSFIAIRAGKILRSRR